jgi:CheY-like chemotaxis protein
VANNGQEGFDKFKEQQPPFSAVLMDMQMPVMDGLESTSLIRKFEEEVSNYILIHSHSHLSSFIFFTTLVL